MAGLNQRNDKGQQGIPAPPDSCAAGRKERYTLYLSSQHLHSHLCSMGRASYNGGRLRCLDLELSLIQPIFSWTLVACFAHALFFCSCCQKNCFSSFHFFPLSANFPSLAVSFSVWGQSSSSCLQQLHKLTSPLVSGRTLLCASAGIEGFWTALHN